MDLQLAGLRALVTGGTRGIGRAVVENFVAEGASVAFCARDADAVQTTQDDLTSAGGQVIGTALDVADPAPLADWVTASAERLGGIDIVVSNVSALAIPDTLENWTASFEIDLMGAVRLVDAAMPFLEASPAASIVAVSSVSGREIDFAAGPYGTIKAALIHYMQGLASQLASKGIRANAVSPGNTYFEGGVWESIKLNNPDLYATALDLNPTGRMGTPDEIARTVVFIASPASSRTSGANILVDGALTRGVQL
ncbi:MAG: SDR family oxidoreductase [Actinomycetota bacterium]|nr:SDR family oxidoreductase [Actinomycetota bacterium]